MVHKWIGAGDASSHEIKSRITAIRLFGKYLCAIGESAYVLPEKYITCGSKFMPHIFTKGELTALFDSIDNLRSTKAEPFLNEIAPTMFRLIYTCGLRPNEGRELLLENVNLDTGRILITHAKCNKERFVVMSDDMQELARSYEQRRIVFGNGNPFFFPSVNGGALTSNTVYAALNKAWSDSNPEGKFPERIRVYDLRHQFASACLNRWLDNGENLMAMLPFLRTYMGHKTLAQTAYCTYFSRKVFQKSGAKSISQRFCTRFLVSLLAGISTIHILPENITKSSAIDWDKFNKMFPEVAE